MLGRNKVSGRTENNQETILFYQTMPEFF